MFSTPYTCVYYVNYSAFASNFIKLAIFLLGWVPFRLHILRILRLVLFG